MSHIDSDEKKHIKLRRKQTLWEGIPVSIIQIIFHTADSFTEKSRTLTGAKKHKNLEENKHYE